MMFETEVILLENKHVKSSDSLYHIENAQKEFHHSKLGVHAFNLWLKDKYTDVTVKINDKSYKAHRPVLSCYSTYFKKHILSTNLKTIQIDELSITPKSFEILLNFMYTGCIDITIQNIGDVYAASKKLGIRKTLNLCEEILMGKVNRNAQCVYLYVTAKKLNEKGGAKRALKIMAHYFEYIVATKEFLDLNFNEVTEYLSCNHLAVRSEMIVYLAALKWLNHDFLEREIYINQVLGCVRFPLMTLNEILACFSPPLLSGIVESPEVEYMLLKSTCYIASKTVGEYERLKKYSCKPRYNLEEKVPLLLWDPNIFSPTRYSHYQKEKAATTIQSEFRKHMADREMQKLQYLCDITVAPYHTIGDETKKNKRKAQHTMKRLSSDIISNAKKYSSLMISMAESKQSEVFETNALGITNDNITDMTPIVEKQLGEILYAEKNLLDDEHYTFMPKPDKKCDTNRKSYEKQIYEVQEISSSEKSQFAKKNKAVTIKESEDLAKTPKSNPEITETRNIEGNMRNKDDEKRIILLGGYDPNNIENTFIGNQMMMEYNPVTDKWSDFGYMPENRHHTCAVYYDYCIYVIGGSVMTDEKVYSESPTNTCLKFDIKQNIWTVISAMWISRIYHGAAAIEDTIYAVGGLDENNNILESIEQYNINENKWDFVDCKLKVPRMCVGVCGYEGNLWIAGGINYDKDIKNVDVFAEVEIYNPSTNDIDISVANLPNPRAYVALVECNKELYCVGGAKYDKTIDESICSVNDIYVYSNDLDMWVAVKPLPNPGHSVSAISFGGVIYVINGLSIRENVVLSEDVLIYDPKKNIWITCSPLSNIREGMCAVCVPAELCDMMKGKEKEIPN